MYRDIDQSPDLPHEIYGDAAWRRFRIDLPADG
jgi:hypothetical protein